MRMIGCGYCWELRVVFPFDLINRVAYIAEAQKHLGNSINFLLHNAMDKLIAKRYYIDVLRERRGKDPQVEATRLG